MATNAEVLAFIASLPAKNLDGFMRAVRLKESSDNYQNTENSNHYGAYQFAYPAFKATGYIIEDTNGNGSYKYYEHIEQ